MNSGRVLARRLSVASVSNRVSMGVYGNNNKRQQILSMSTVACPKHDKALCRTKCLLPCGTHEISRHHVRTKTISQNVKIKYGPQLRRVSGRTRDKGHLSARRRRHRHRYTVKGVRTVWVRACRSTINPASLAEQIEQHPVVLCEHTFNGALKCGADGRKKGVLCLNCFFMLVDWSTETTLPSSRN